MAERIRFGWHGPGQEWADGAGYYLNEKGNMRAGQFGAKQLNGLGLLRKAHGPRQCGRFQGSRLVEAMPIPVSVLFERKGLSQAELDHNAALIFPDGSFYSGGLNAQNQRHGSGVLYAADASVLQGGHWLHDEFQAAAASAVRLPDSDVELAASAPTIVSHVSEPASVTVTEDSLVIPFSPIGSPARSSAGVAAFTPDPVRAHSTAAMSPSSGSSSPQSPGSSDWGEGGELIFDQFITSESQTHNRSMELDVGAIAAAIAAGLAAASSGGVSAVPSATIKGIGWAVGPSSSGDGKFFVKSHRSSHSSAENIRKRIPYENGFYYLVVSSTAQQADKQKSAGMGGLFSSSSVKSAQSHSFHVTLIQKPSEEGTREYQRTLVSALSVTTEPAAATSKPHSSSVILHFEREQRKGVHLFKSVTADEHPLFMWIMNREITAGDGAPRNQAAADDTGHTIHQIVHFARVESRSTYTVSLDLPAGEYALLVASDDVAGSAVPNAAFVQLDDGKPSLIDKECRPLARSVQMGCSFTVIEVSVFQPAQGVSIKCKWKKTEFRIKTH